MNHKTVKSQAEFIIIGTAKVCKEIIRINLKKKEQVISKCEIELYEFVLKPCPNKFEFYVKVLARI